MIVVKIIFYKKAYARRIFTNLKNFETKCFYHDFGALKTDRCAVTVSSVTSLSLEPPLIIVCINKNASMHENF